MPPTSDIITLIIQATALIVAIGVMVRQVDELLDDHPLHPSLAPVDRTAEHLSSPT